MRKVAVGLLCLATATAPEWRRPRAIDALEARIAAEAAGYAAEEIRTEEVRLIDAYDLTIPPDGRAEQDIETTRQSADTAARLFSIATHGRLEVKFGEPEVVRLPFDASGPLCALENTDAWGDQLFATENQILLLAAQQGVPPDGRETLIRMRFSACPPEIDIGNNRKGAIRGRASVNERQAALFVDRAGTKAHELGHLLRLGHANVTVCNFNKQGTRVVNDDCELSEVKDNNLMGGVLLGTDGLHGAQLLGMGLLPGEQVINVERSGTFRIQALHDGGTLPTILRVNVPEEVQQQTGLEGDLYIELSSGPATAVDTPGCDTAEEQDDFPWCVATQGVSMKIMRLTGEPDYQDVLVYDVGVLGRRWDFGAAASLPGGAPEFQDATGITVNLLDLASGTSSNGRATVRVEVPDWLWSEGRSTARIFMNILLLPALRD